MPFTIVPVTMLTLFAKAFSPRQVTIEIAFNNLFYRAGDTDNSTNPLLLKEALGAWSHTSGDYAVYSFLPQEAG